MPSDLWKNIDEEKNEDLMTIMICKEVNCLIKGLKLPWHGNLLFKETQKFLELRRAAF